MTRRTPVVFAGGAALALGLTAPAAAAAPAGTPTVVNREVVAAQLDPSGKLDVARLLSQLSVVGTGTVHVADPVSGKGLRNLDGFGTPTVRDGKARYTIHVDGTATRRTVSDFTKDLPVEVSASYTLDGRPVKPNDIVGKTGDVTVTYLVSNVSGTPTPITWKDGNGVSQTETVDLVTPYAGQLRTTLPGTFAQLLTPAADAAADGHGGTVLSYSMVLFEPLGHASQQFTWSGHVRHARVPAVELQLVPVSPTEKPELQTGVAGYRDGAAQAAELTQGAGQIDTHLLALQQGAGQLLAGLTKLAAGAAQLRDGLGGPLADGAARVAAGAKDARAGTSELRAGLGDLSDGADELSGGLGQAAAGSSALAAGMQAADTGAAALSDGIAAIVAGVNALPASLQSDPAYQQLLGVLTAVKAAIGSPADVSPATLLGGLNLLGYGLRSPLGVLGCDRTAPTGSATACGVADAVQLVQEQLAAAAAPGGSVDGLITAATTAYAAAGCTAPPAPTPVTGVLPPSSVPGTDPAACVPIATLAYGLGLPAGVLTQTDPGGLKAQTQLAAATLHAVFSAVDDAIIPGMAQVKAGLSNPACDPADPTAAGNPCGIKEVQTLVGAGIGQLVDAISTELSGVLSQAATGAQQLSSGISQLADGSTALDDGLGALADGGVQLAHGASDAAAGSGALDDGLGKLAGGAGELAAGVDKAAAGSKDVAGGLARAKAGDAKVVDGAGRLRSEGTSALVSGGNAAAGAAAKKYATLLALAKKAEGGALPYGAPDGATGSAAYQLTLAAATTAAHDNATRGVAAVLLLGAACALSGALRHRFPRR